MDQPNNFNRANKETFELKVKYSLGNSWYLVGLEGRANKTNTSEIYYV